MRQAYALLGLAKKWGPERVDAACERAAEAEAFKAPLPECAARTDRRPVGQPISGNTRRW